MKDGMRNIVSGIISQVILLAVGLIIPRYFLLRFGSDINGLQSTANQVLSYFVLFEAGVGMASLQALYKPAALNDRDAIQGILSATRLYYRRIGLWVMLATVAVSLVFPLVLKTDAPYLTVLSIMLVLGMSSVVSFFSYGKNVILLQAQNKVYVVNTVITISVLVVSGLKLFLLQQPVDLVFILLLSLLQTLLYAAMYALYFKKRYPWLNSKAKPDYGALSQRKSAFVHQVSGLIFANTDILLIAVAIDVKIASIYAIYNMVYTSVNSLMAQLYSGIKSRLGQLYNLDAKAYQAAFSGYESLYLAFSFALVTAAYLLVMPFMQLYTAGITDINYIDPSLALLFCVISLINNARIPMNDTIIFAGHFTDTRWHSIVESITNLVVSIALLPFLGVYGVLLGTIAALGLRFVLIYLYTQQRLLQGTAWSTTKNQLLHVLVFVLLVWMDSLLTFAAPGNFSQFLGLAVFKGALAVLMYLLVNFAFNRKALQALWQALKPGEK